MPLFKLGSLRPLLGGRWMKKKDVVNAIAQGNRLIEGAFDITLIEMRLLYLALAKVDSRNPQPEGEYKFQAKEYQEMYSLDSRNSYEQLKSAVNSLGRKPIITYEWNEEDQILEKVQRFWFSSIRYAAASSTSDITLRFSESVRDYLYELKNEFTLMNLADMVKLDTPFAFRLYSWLFKYRNLNKSKKHHGVITTDVLEIEWMKERTGLIGKYPVFQDFKRRVLDPAVATINANSPLSVTYETEKVGKKVAAIIFSYIDERDVASVADITIKPKRPRMPNRPHATQGSAREGQWARECINLMKEYVTSAKAYDSAFKITPADKRSIKNWYEIIGQKVPVLLS